MEHDISLEVKNGEIIYLTYDNATYGNNYNICYSFLDGRALSYIGSPYDNGVAEATYKIIKTEFAFNKIFTSFEELELELFDYVN